MSDSYELQASFRCSVFFAFMLLVFVCVLLPLWQNNLYKILLM